MAVGKVPVIGFLADWLDPGYQQVVLHGAMAATRDRDLKLIGYVTHSTISRGLERASVRRLFGTTCVDGWVVIAPSLQWGTTEEQEVVHSRMKTIPTCYVATEVPGASCVSIDNPAGVRAVVQHLIFEHKYCNFAFVCGPDGNSEAEQRLLQFRQVLAEAGLAVNEKHILPGNFTVPAGANAIDLLLGERQVAIATIDAIVAANDGMAIGVLEGLEARGIRAPKQVAVTGFDDCAVSRYLRTPLTTVRQPLFEQGKLAVRTLLEHIRTGEPQRHQLRTELVVRRSCGCASGIGLHGAVGTPSGGTGLSFDAAMIGGRQVLLAELTRAGRGELGVLGTGWEPRIVGTLVDELKGRSADAFRREFEGMLEKLGGTGSEPSRFHEIVSLLWRHLVPCCTADPELRTRLEHCLDDARLIIAAAMQRVQGAEHVKHQTKNFEFIAACTDISAAVSLEQLAGLLERHASAMGITHLELALYSEGLPTVEAMRVLSYAEGRGQIMATEVRVEDLPGIVLGEKRELPGILCTTLEFEQETLGVMVTNFCVGEGVLYHPIQAAFSTGVMGIRLRHQLKARNS